MTTKEKILNESLKLFSERGYSDVSVSDIAAAVGIKAPSLYKHFKSKQEILDSCIERFSERIMEVRNSLMMSGTDGSGLDYSSSSIEMITEFAIGLFMFYLRDDIASKFRKMLTMERYRSPEINKVYEEIFINGGVEYEERIFAELIKSGVIKNENPHIIAVRFYSPIFYLLQKYDTCIGNDDVAKTELVSMVEEFCKVYKG